MTASSVLQPFPRLDKANLWTISFVFMYLSHRLRANSTVIHSICNLSLSRFPANQMRTQIALKATIDPRVPEHIGLAGSDLHFLLFVPLNAILFSRSAAWESIKSSKAVWSKKPERAGERYTEISSSHQLPNGLQCNPSSAMAFLITDHTS